MLFSLALRLGRTAGDLEEALTSSELSDWIVFLGASGESKGLDLSTREGDVQKALGAAFGVKGGRR